MTIEDVGAALIASLHRPPENGWVTLVGHSREIYITDVPEGPAGLLLRPAQDEGLEPAGKEAPRLVVRVCAPPLPSGRNSEAVRSIDDRNPRNG